MNSDGQIIELNKLPNIGRVLAEKLFFAGIESSKQLFTLGLEKAFIKLVAYDSTVCIQHIYAMAGALKGIRWHDLSGAEKKELQALYHRLKI